MERVREQRRTNRRTCFDRQTPSLSSTLCVFGISSWTSCPIRQNQSCQLYSSHCVHFDKIRVAAVTFRTERLPHSTELSATHMNGLFVKCFRLLKMSRITTQEWRFLGATHHPNVDQIRAYASEYVTVKCTKTPVCHLTLTSLLGFPSVGRVKDLSNTSSWLFKWLNSIIININKYQGPLEMFTQAM